MSKFTIYHNPRCSKSRQALTLLEEHGITPEVVPYLEQAPSADELKDLLKKLNLKPRDLLRSGEAEYKDNKLDDPQLSDDDLLAAMTRHPRLIQRPIVVRGEQAVIGRPPENVLALL